MTIKKTNRLSHSAVNKFMTCAKSYQFHYLDKIRSTVTHSALCFGSSLDVALGAMLADYQRGNLDELGQAYEKVFINNWREGKINDKVVPLFDNPDLVYAASDLDTKLFEQKDWFQIFTAGQNVYLGIKAFKEPTSEAIMEVYEMIQAEKESKGWEGVPLNARKFYNYMNWMCLTKKGILMLETYRKEVIPRIKQVLSIQEQVNLENDDGDSIIGYIDLVAVMDDGKTYVLDNKTSARDYEWDAVQKSQQLALYVHAVEAKYNTRNAGFLVLSKSIDKQSVKTCKTCGFDMTGSRAKTCTSEASGKRCGGEMGEVLNPKAKVQIMLGEIPARLDTLVLENMMDVSAAIKTGVFPRNLNSCSKPFLCPFYNKCHHGSDAGLVDMKEEVKE